MAPTEKSGFAEKIDNLFKANGWKNNQLAPAVSGSVIQKIKRQNYLPGERTIGKMAVAMKKEGHPVEYEELIELRRQAKSKSTVNLSAAHKQKAPTTGPVPVFSRQLSDSISHLHTTDEIRESVIRVLSHPDYPRWMAISGKLVRNPLWDQIPEKRRAELQRLHQLDGLSPPTIMHLDMLLIRRNDSRGRGELYTYVSRDWGTCRMMSRSRSVN